MKKVYVLYNESEDEIKVYDSWEKAFNKFDAIAKDNSIRLDDYIFSSFGGLDRVECYDAFELYVEAFIVE